MTETPEELRLTPGEAEQLERALDGEAVVIEPLRQLMAEWRTSAAALASTNAAWSSHFYDCANELERTLTP